MEELPQQQQVICRCGCACVCLALSCMNWSAGLLNRLSLERLVRSATPTCTSHPLTALLSDNPLATMRCCCCCSSSQPLLHTQQPASYNNPHFQVRQRPFNNNHIAQTLPPLPLSLALVTAEALPARTLLAATGQCQPYRFPTAIPATSLI
jgi:hypothetical protein